MTDHPHDGDASTTGAEAPRGRGQHPHSAGETVEQALTEFADAAKQAAEAVNKRAGRDIFIATVVGVGLLAIVGASLLWLPWGFAVFVTAAAVASQVEVGQVLAKQRGIRIVSVPLMIGSGLLVLTAYGSHLANPVVPVRVMDWIIGLTVVAVLIVRLVGPIEGFVADVTSTLFLMVYPALLVTALMFILAADQGPLLIALFIAGIAASDTGGYFVGMLLGKHKMSPRISPKKSWEGAAGSLVLSGVVIILIAVLALHIPWWKGMIIAIVLVVAGILGDLVESVIKRDLGIKDMGTLLPGHGGVMDRIDSYILAAVPVWLAMEWLLPNV
ncbi:MAG: phosphatidate cytidylyltransferase [Propionibacteriaceae bacterium]|nr:phosphatidate cytidylyltransferase [Propionibacteriaceae bacterium]